jgi:hypothetical protein
VAVALDGTYIAVPNGTTTGQVSFLSATNGYAVAQSVPVGANPVGMVAMSSGVVVTQFNDAGTITVLTGVPGSLRLRPANL